MESKELLTILDRVATHLAMHIQEQRPDGVGPICVHVADAYELIAETLEKAQVASTT